MHFPSIWERLFMTFISFKIVISLESNLLSFILRWCSRNHSTFIDRSNLSFFKICSFCLCVHLSPHPSSDFSLGAQGRFFAVQASPDTFQVPYLPLKKNPCVLSAATSVSYHHSIFRTVRC